MGTENLVPNLFSTVNISGDTICYTLYKVLNFLQLLYRNNHMAIFLIGLFVSTLYQLEVRGGHQCCMLGNSVTEDK